MSCGRNAVSPVHSARGRCYVVWCYIWPTQYYVQVQSFCRSFYTEKAAPTYVFGYSKGTAWQVDEAVQSLVPSYFHIWFQTINGENSIHLDAKTKGLLCIYLTVLPTSQHTCDLHQHWNSVTKSFNTVSDRTDLKSSAIDRPTAMLVSLTLKIPR